MQGSPTSPRRCGIRWSSCGSFIARRVNFEADVLDGIKDGFRASGGASPAVAEVTVKTSMEVHAGASTPSGLAFNPFVHK